MEEKEVIAECYRNMYRGMIEKDRDLLSDVLALFCRTSGYPCGSSGKEGRIGWKKYGECSCLWRRTAYMAAAVEDLAGLD